MSDLAPPAPSPDDPEARRRFGRYYTPAPLVGALHRLLADALAEDGLAPGQCALVDPSCGAGAFLGVPEATAYGARHGLDLDAAALETARVVAPDATLVCGDAYAGGLDALRQALAQQGPLAVVGNPPYVANSELLKSGRYQAVRDALLPFARDVAKGTSVRDDYVLFFGVADRLIEAAGGRGAIAYVTSASFVDNFLYAPLRRWLLSRYRLRALVELGPEIFPGTRVATSLSVWVRDERGQAGRTFGHLRLTGDREDRIARLEGALPLEASQPHGEALLLNAPGEGTTQDLAAMRLAGDRLGSLFPLSFPGLKTRFEELLVDEDGGRLAARLRDFFEATEPEAFAKRHAIREKAMPKLLAAFAAREHTRFDKAKVRPFARFAGPKHRFRIPRPAFAWAYVDPELIPRGDHRFHGQYDPHRLGPKLVFNAREVPLVSAVVEGPACVHDWQHSRFAPLWAPQLLVEGGLFQVKATDQLGPRALNLAPAWKDSALRLREPADLFFYVCAVINSALVQERFAPVAGASEEVPIPRLGPGELAKAQRIADVARALSCSETLPPAAERAVRALFGL